MSCEIDTPRSATIWCDLQEGDLDEVQERQVARALDQQHELITRDAEAVARDTVEQHFLARETPGKTLVASIDKVTAARTFEKVQRFWALEGRELALGGWAGDKVNGGNGEQVGTGRCRARASETAALPL